MNAFLPSLLSPRACLAPLALSALFQIAALAGPALADDTQVIDLSAPADTAADTANVTVLNDGATASDFDFGGGVGSGPDLSGNGNMVQIVQPIAATNNAGTTSNGQISYRYVATPPAGGH